jgi:putative DNA primase/helicase
MTESRLVQPPGDPYKNAGLFLGEFYSGLEHGRLLYHGGTFYEWMGPCWSEVEDGALRGQLYEFFAEMAYLDAQGALQPFAPTRHKVADLVDALGALTHLPRATVPPAWLDPTAERVAPELVSCANGILHVPSRQLHPHSPLLYVHHNVPFDFAPDAPEPKRWLAFLDELWPDDPDAVAALQMMYGYVLSGATRLQKMFMVVGPKRSGKGTIARVLKALVGEHHVAGPTLSSLSSNFGLQPLIGKTLAIVSDARISDGHSIVIERLLSISGEDMLTIDRKYKDPWTGTLGSRIVVLTNELPRLTDSSGALASRFVIFVTRETFYGRENPRLTDELLGELPAILNWTLDGIDRLAESGRLIQPESSTDAIRELEDLSSPHGAFVRDKCVVGPAHRVRVSVLYQAWKDWCDVNGRKPGSTQVFGRDLRAAVIGVKTIQPLDDDGVSRVRMYQGVDLRR